MSEVVEQLSKLVEAQEQSIKTGNAETIAKLENENESLIKGHEKLFRSICLHFASKLGNLDLVKHLIDTNADVNFRLVPGKVSHNPFNLMYRATKNVMQ